MTPDLELEPRGGAAVWAVVIFALVAGAGCVYLISQLSVVG